MTTTVALSDIGNKRNKPCPVAVGTHTDGISIKVSPQGAEFLLEYCDGILSMKYFTDEFDENPTLLWDKEVQS